MVARCCLVCGVRSKRPQHVGKDELEEEVRQSLVQEVGEELGIEAHHEKIVGFSAPSICGSGGRGDGGRPCFAQT